MKLATQDRGFFGESFKEKLTKVRELGFEGLEIGGNVLIDRFAEIKQAISSTGVPISSICGGYRGWIGAFEEEERKKAISDIGEIFRYTAEIGATGVIVPAAFGIFSRKLPPFSPPRSMEDDRETLLDSLNKLDVLAKEAGSTLFLEPLNRYEDHMINRLEQAASLINEGGFSHVKILADFFHMNTEEANISESILATGNLIGHVHLADSNRLMPGQGHIDFESSFNTLQKIGFNQFMSIECEISGDPEQSYLDSAAFLQSFIKPGVA
ncbi:sugar phosphate isomerase/epimerase family protein [Bacillaceae bacterium C204]|uniref:sugar phosphate isomerase/epimerase family protein n=1 Tax=Neobacillus sp. 204 TaxID=3383351 RepID=UPI00397DBCE3